MNENKPRPFKEQFTARGIIIGVCIALAQAIMIIKGM